MESSGLTSIVAVHIDDDWAVLDIGAVAGVMSFPFSAEWAIEPTYMYHAVEMLRHMSAKDIADMQREFLAREQARGGSGGPSSDEKPYKVYDGVAHLNLAGMMTKRPTCMGSLFGEDMSTVKLRELARTANRDPDVKSKLTKTDSPGGEVAGAFDLGDDLAGGKPLDVFYEDMGASAALIATMGARHATANQNAVLGSAGVYTALHDTSVMRERVGSKVHVVKAGRHKAIGHPGLAVSDADLAVVQSRVDALHGLFLQRIARGRPNMSAKQLAEVGDAGVYIGREAIKAGLIDGIGSFDEAHRQAVKSNNEGTRRVTVIKDKQLAAYLSGDQKLIAEALAETQAIEASTIPPPVATEGETPPTRGTAIVQASANPLLAELDRLGVRSIEDLRDLATDASAGRAALTMAREKATALAVAVFKDGTDKGAALLKSAENFLASAPIDVVNDASANYEDRLKGMGLTAPTGESVAARHSAAALVGAVPVDATTAPPKKTMVDEAKSYTESVYGGHAQNGRGK